MKVVYKNDNKVRNVNDQVEYNLSEIVSSIEIDTNKENLESSKFPIELKTAIEKGYQVFTKTGAPTAKGGLIVKEFESKGKNVVYKPEGDTSNPQDNEILVFGSGKTGLIKHKSNGVVVEINSNNIIQDLFELYNSLSTETGKNEIDLVDEILETLNEDIGTERNVHLEEFKTIIGFCIDYFDSIGMDGLEVMRNYLINSNFTLGEIERYNNFLNSDKEAIKNKILSVANKEFNTEDFYRSDEIMERFEENIQMSFEDVYQEIKKKIPVLTREQLKDRIVFISEADWLKRNLSNSSWGFVRNGVMYLRAGENDSVNRIAVLHEMGHIIYDEFLTTKEKEIIREEYKKQFKKAGREIEVQEWFADVLALSVDKKIKISLGQRITNLINKILNLLGFIRDNNRNLNDILSAFNNGIIGSRKVSQEERAIS